MSCVHKYSEDLHICGYWVDLEKIAPACDARPAGAHRPRQGDHRAAERPRRRGHLRGRRRQGRRRRRDRPPPHRQGGGRRPRPRPLLRGVPGPGREGVRLAQLAERRAGRGADPRRRRRRRRRPPLLGRPGARPGPRPGREPRPRRRPRRNRDASTRRTPRRRPRTAWSCARSSASSRRPHRTSTARTTRSSRTGAPTRPTAWASRRCRSDAVGQAQLGGDQVLLLEVVEDLLRRLLGRLARGLDAELGVLRLLVGVGDAGELLDLAGAGLRVEALDVARLAVLERGGDEDLDEAAVHQLRGPRRGSRGRARSRR